MLKILSNSVILHWHRTWKEDVVMSFWPTIENCLNLRQSKIQGLIYVRNQTRTRRKSNGLGMFSEQGQKELVFIDENQNAERYVNEALEPADLPRTTGSSSSWWMTLLAQSSIVSRTTMADSPSRRRQTSSEEKAYRTVQGLLCVRNQTRTRRKSNGLGRDQWTGAEGTGFHQWKPEHWAIRQWSIGTSCLAISETREPVHLDWRQCSPSSSIVSITTTADVEWRECIQDGTRTDVCGESNKDKKEE